MSKIPTNPIPLMQLGDNRPGGDDVKIHIETSDDLDCGLTLEEHRQLTSTLYSVIKERFEHCKIEPTALVRLESSLIDSIEHSQNWPGSHEDPDESDDS